MTVDLDEHKRTLAFAEIALDQIKALKQAATPRNFEIWYAYATTHVPQINKALNDALARDGSISQADLDTIYDMYLSAARFNERIEAVGSKMAGEISEVRASIAAAATSNSSYSTNLADANQSLDASPDVASLKQIIHKLATSSAEMAQVNKTLASQLAASSKEISQLQGDLEAVRTESYTDPLTTLGNRKFFDQSLQKAIADANPPHEPFSLLLMDIDHFKKFNDTYGHLTGDQVLRLVAGSLKQTVKGQDVTARYGGEEFAVILPSTGLRQATTVADQIRRAVAANKLIKRSTGEHLGNVTISIGAAVFHAGETAQHLIARADECLYAAKRNGRNCVVCETDPEMEAAKPAKVA